VKCARESDRIRAPPEAVAMRRVIMSFAMLSALTDAGVAQQPSSTPAFEAASVKHRITNSSGWPVSYTPDSWHATNATLSGLIQSAYGVRPDRLADEWRSSCSRTGSVLY
jgi:hypothetical protein